jgi:hypothetical protein
MAQAMTQDRAAKRDKTRLVPVPTVWRHTWDAHGKALRGWCRKL